MPVPIRIDYFTDPLCSWCFAIEPVLERLKREFGSRIEIHYRLFPLFTDLKEALSEPTRLWNIADRYRIVSKKTGIPIDNRVWYEDPPHSAYPPAESVKAAERQGLEAVDRYIGLLRIAVMREAKNIARREVQIETAGKAGLDLAQFEKDLADPRLREEVDADVNEAIRQNVESRPAFLISNSVGDKVYLCGPRNYDVFAAAVDGLYREQPEP